MYVGIFGDVIFSVGHLRVLTPSNFKGTTGANWAEHEVLGGKARAEYLSPKLREYTFDILLDAALGVNPRKMLNRLTEMSENGEIHYLIIGFAPVSQNKFRVTEISDSWDSVIKHGLLMQCKVRVHMIDFSSTVVELSGDSEKQKEVQDIAKCLRTLYSTPIGSQEGDRELGINPNIFVDKPLPVAKGLYVAEVTEKTASFEPRARVVRVDWLDSDVLHGVVIPKVVYELV